MRRRLVMALVTWLALAWGVQPLPASANAPPAFAETLQGTLLVRVVDDFQRDRSRMEYYLRTAEGEEVPLEFGQGTPDALSGASIQASGIRGPQGLRVGSASGPDFTIISPATNIPAGPKKVAIILINFQDNPIQPVSADAIRSTVFTASDSANAYFKATSFGQTSLTGKLRSDGDVFGWYTIPYNSTSATCDYELWHQAADAAAAAAGVDLSGYDNTAYYFPSMPACQFGGLGYVGYGVFWINGSNSPSTFAHELGHNFGASHASAYRCVDGAGLPVAISASCTVDEYGDPFDVMGSAYYQMNSYHQGSVNYLSAGNTRVVTTSGTYTLQSAEQASSGVVNLEIPRDRDAQGAVTTYYSLEYRRPSGAFDTFAPTDPVVQGVTIRQGTPYATYRNTWLIDTTPFTPSFQDAPLTVGHTFIDPTSNISIQVLGVTSTAATVSVSLAPIACTRAAPTASLSPATQSSAAAHALAYTVTVTNNDSGCTNNAYTLTPSLPGGWTQTADTPTLSMPPGYSASTTVRITAPAGTAPGSYPITETATNVAASQSTATASATYTVVPPLQVTSAGDAATCPNGAGRSGYTLRCAIADANAAGSPSTITFAIPSSDPRCVPARIWGQSVIRCVITLAGSLPPLTAPGAIIDGYSQPGAAPNSLPAGTGDNAVLPVELAGAGARTLLEVDGAGSVVRGLAFVAAGENGLAVGNSTITVAGNFIGVTSTGDAVGNANDGISLFPGNWIAGVLIGGTTPADANWIGANGGYGISVNNTHDSVIAGNYLGDNPAATVSTGNTAGGVQLGWGWGNTVGGAGNVVLGNRGNGVDVGAGFNSTSVIEGNLIGIDGTGREDGNGGEGVAIHDAATGGLVRDNTIAGNARSGVLVGADSTQNSEAIISRNRIFDNAGLGIDLAPEGAVTCTGPLSGAPNNDIPCPAISGVSDRSIAGTACASCTVEVFRVTSSLPTTNGQGAVYLGTAMTDTAGAWVLPAPFAATIGSGDLVTATATSGAIAPGQPGAALSAVPPATRASVAIPPPGGPRPGLTAASSLYGTSEFSQNVAVTATPPGAPTAVMATAGDGQITLSWGAAPPNGSPISGYTATCERASDGGEQQSMRVDANTFEVMFTNLSNGTLYTCAVTATNANGSATSSPVTATPGPPNTAPTLTASSPSPTAAYGSPLTFTITAADPDTGDTLTWRPVSGLPTGVTAAIAAPRTGGASTLTITGTGSGGRVTAAAGTYPISVGVSDGVNPDVSASYTLTVTRQNVTLAPLTGTTTMNPPAPVSVFGGSSGVSGTLTFVASIKEVWFGARGYAAIDAATPFSVALTRVVSNGMGATPSLTCGTTGAASIIAGGVSALTGRCTVSRVPVGVYLVRLAIGGGSPYFSGAENLVLTVVDTSAATGYREYGAGALAATGGRAPAGFGFLATPCTTAGAPNPSGGFVYVEHRTSGDVVVTAGSGSATSCGLTGILPKTATLSAGALRSDSIDPMTATLTATGASRTAPYGAFGLTVRDAGAPTDINVTAGTVARGKIVTG